MADERLEKALRSVSIPRKNTVEESSARPRWLHVFSFAYPTGGHTALARRWIEMAPKTEYHDVALIYQSEADWPEALVHSVNLRGGKMIAVKATSTDLVARADALRILSEKYDAVVLHVQPWDVVPIMAFGAEGGCPVLLVNHADHIFWFGCSVADAVINIRSSGELLSQDYRGCRTNIRLPVPIPAPKTTLIDNKERLEIRKNFGIDPNAIVFLTVGNRAKYVPAGDFSFLDAASRILDRRSDAIIVVVGPSAEEDGWPSLISRYEQRIRVVGIQTDLTPYFSVSDIYIEGFPFGSLTALLEAVLAGLAPVLAPSRCPVPYRSDDFALDSLPIAKDIESYVDLALSLAADIPAAKSHAASLSKLLQATHSSPGWISQLSAVADLVHNNPSHSVTAIENTRPLDFYRVQYWAEYLDSFKENTAFNWSYQTAMRAGLTPRMDQQMFAALQSAKEQGISSLKPWMTIVGSYVSAALPRKIANYLYEKI